MPIESDWISHQRIPCLVKKRAWGSKMLIPRVMGRTQPIPCSGFPPHLNLDGSEFYSLALPSVLCLTSQLFWGLRGGGVHITKKVRPRFSMKMEGRALWQRKFGSSMDPDGTNTSWFHGLFPPSSQNSLSVKQIFKRTGGERSCLNPLFHVIGFQGKIMKK